MSIADLYNLLEKIQIAVGCDCRVFVSIPSSNLLQFDVDWTTEEKHIRYTRCVSAQEFRYIGDLEHYVNWFCAVAIRHYKLATVGEE